MDDQHVNDRRKTDKSPESIFQISAIDSFTTLLLGLQLSDILTTRKHSVDFSDTRAHFILRRLRLMLYIFAVLAPLSFIIDLVLLETHQATQMLYARLSLSAALIVLAQFCRTSTTSIVFNYLLPAGFILPTLFYVVSKVILAQQGADFDAAGYDFMPYFIVVMLALFPLTFGHSVVIVGLIFIPFIIVESQNVELLSFTTINKIWAFAMFAGVSIWLQLGQLAMLMKLYRESTLDPLTGLTNRRVLMKRIGKEIAEKNDFYVLMFDLDKFKRINDTHGHLNGDLVLVAMADIIKDQMRANDIVARFGGEEFVAVLTGVMEGDALATAERIRKKCEETVIHTSQGVSLRATTSIGVTLHRSSDAIEVTLNRVDDLLYQAKAQGRNRVISG